MKSSVEYGLIYGLNMVCVHLRAPVREMVDTGLPAFVDQDVLQNAAVGGIKKGWPL